MRIVGYKTSMLDNKVLLEESSREAVTSDNPKDLLIFLLEPYEDSIKVCWDLDATVAPILKTLGVEVCSRLQKRKRAIISPFSLFYVPGKVFCVKHIPTNANCNLYELQQYFPEQPEPADIDELLMFGQKLLEELEKMGLQPTKLTSPIAIYEECIMRNMNLPALKDIPLEAAELAYKCSGKLWIESHQLGYWDKVSDYDMNSAFPSILKDLIDFRDCDWIESTDYQPNAIYGYTECDTTIYDWVMLSPIMADLDEGLISYTGKHQLPLCKKQIDFINKYKTGSTKITKGHWAIPKKNKTELSKPLYTPMTKLLTYKQRSILQALLSKRMSTGVYGKLGEERADEFGQYMNPVWFAETSIQTTLRLAELLYTYQIGPSDNDGYKTLLHIGVDGAMLSRPIIGFTNDRWKLAYEGDALIISSGLVYTRQTKPKGLHLNEILDLINANPNKQYYSKGVRRRLTLGDSLSQSRLSDIGKEFTFQSSINLLDQDHDRYFAKTPRTGKSLLTNKYTSAPRRIE